MPGTLASNESVESIYIEEDTIEESTIERVVESLVEKVSAEPVESLPIDIVVTESIEESAIESVVESLVEKVSAEPVESLPIEMAVTESVDSFLAEEEKLASPGHILKSMAVLAPTTKKTPEKEQMPLKKDEEEGVPESGDAESGEKKSEDSPSENKDKDVLSKSPETVKNTWIDWTMQRKKKLLIRLGIGVPENCDVESGGKITEDSPSDDEDKNVVSKFPETVKNTWIDLTMQRKKKLLIGLGIGVPENCDVESGEKKTKGSPSDVEDKTVISKSTWIDWMMQRKKQLLIVLVIFVLVFIIGWAVGSASSRKNKGKANAVETAVETAENGASSISVPTIFPTPGPEALPTPISQPIFSQEPTDRPTSQNDGALVAPIPDEGPEGPIPVDGRPAAKKPNPTTNPTRNPIANPTVFRTKIPTPTPTKMPTPSPTLSPTKLPTFSPTSMGPTDSARPTIDFPALIEDFLEEFHDANIYRYKGYYNPESMAVDWLAKENTPESIIFDDKLVQRFALLALDFSMQKAKKGWELPMNGVKDVDECNWTGISCDDNGRVDKIEWSYQENTYKGLITPEIKHLKSLKYLDLSNNQIEKEIPESFYQLTNLESVYLYNNRLKGSISTQIGNLKALKYFHLARNKKIWGRIPSEIGYCEELSKYYMVSIAKSATRR